MLVLFDAKVTAESQPASNLVFDVAFSLHSDSTLYERVSGETSVPSEVENRGEN